MPNTMYVPITSEITLGTGTVLREISTGQLFEVGERLKHGAEVSGEDEWTITPVGDPNPQQRSAVTLSRQELAQKYFADDDA